MFFFSCEAVFDHASAQVILTHTYLLLLGLSQMQGFHNREAHCSFLTVRFQFVFSFRSVLFSVLIPSCSCLRDVACALPESALDRCCGQGERDGGADREERGKRENR